MFNQTYTKKLRDIYIDIVIEGKTRELEQLIDIFSGVFSTIMTNHTGYVISFYGESYGDKANIEQFEAGLHNLGYTQR